MRWRTICFAIALSLLGGTARGDLLILKDGRRLDGRLGGQDKDTISFYVQRGAVSTRMDFARDEVAEIRDTPAQVSQTTSAPSAAPAAPAAGDRPPALLALMNQYCSNAMATFRTGMAAPVSTDTSAPGLGTARGLIGRRVLVSGVVADVLREGDTFLVMLQPMKSSAISRLSRADEQQIEDAQEEVDEARAAIDELQKRNAPRVYNGLDERAWRLRMESHKKAIARMKRDAFERKPAHVVQVRTQDPAARSLRRGSGVQFEATVSSFEMVNGYAPAPAEESPLQAAAPVPEQVEFCIHCEAVADRVKPSREVPQMPLLEAEEAAPAN